jgi:hypothetical protein
LREIDFAGEAERRYESMGLNVPRFRERLRCCEIYIGLDACVYNAFLGRWTDLEIVLSLVQELVRRSR